MRFAYGSRARDDIAAIYYYRSAHHSAEVAARVEKAIREAVAMLAVHPEFGSKTDHRLDVRRWPMTDYPYTIFYHIDRMIGQIMIIRVIDSGRVRNVKRVPRS